MGVKFGIEEWSKFHFYRCKIIIIVFNMTLDKTQMKLQYKNRKNTMPWIVDNSIKQFIVTVLQQLIEFCQISRAEDIVYFVAATHWHVGGLSRYNFFTNFGI